MSLEAVKRLSFAEYSLAKDKAISLVKKEIGQKPTRSQLKREQSPLLDILDYLGLIVFVAAFVVSSLHVFHHIEKQASLSWNKAHTQIKSEDAGDVADAETPGIMQYFTKDSYVTFSQIGMIFLAEMSMILFMTIWRRETKGKPVIRRFNVPVSHINVSFGLAILAMMFVLVANFNSGLNILEALMPPLFTIGLGFQLEAIVDELLERRKDLAKRFLEKMNYWEKYNEQPTNYPDYRSILMQCVWEKILAKKENAQFQDANARLKFQAVMREIERDSWIVEEDNNIKVAEIVGVENTDSLPEDDVDKFYILLKNSLDSNKGGTIQVGGFIANLDKLSWVSPSGEQYGPYKNRGMVKLSVTAYRKRLHKNDKPKQKIVKAVIK